MKAVDCDRENNGNERERDYYDRNTSRHAFCCQLLTFSYYLPVPKPVRYCYVYVRRNFYFYFGTKSMLYCQ